MRARAEIMEVDISRSEIDSAFIYSCRALGNAHRLDMTDVVLVKPESFDMAHTGRMAREIRAFNAILTQDRPSSYLLIGPGRWGSADRWPGIPVAWPNTSHVGAIVETWAPNLKADPSQGSHFFHNVNTLGINYLTISSPNDGFINWELLTSQYLLSERQDVALARLPEPFTLKVDGRTSRGVIYFQH